MNTINKATLTAATITLLTFGITAQAEGMLCSLLLDSLSVKETNSALFYNATSPQIRNKLNSAINNQSLYQPYSDEIKVVFKTYLLYVCIDNPNMQTYTASKLALEQTKQLAKTVLGRVN